MGKQRRQRQKLHQEAPKSLQSPSPTITIPTTSFMQLAPKPIISAPLLSSNNLFNGLKIDFSSLKTNLNNDDVRSIKSYKSVKSEAEKKNITLSKKDKLKLRHEMFLNKIDASKAATKYREIQKKRTNVAIIGNTNPLHDALPSLDSLLKRKTDVPYKGQSESKKSKGIEKSNKQKTTHLKGIKTYKQILKNKQFQKDPFSTVSQHLKSLVEFEKSNIGK